MSDDRTAVAVVLVIGVVAAFLTQRSIGHQTGPAVMRRRAQSAWLGRIRRCTRAARRRIDYPPKRLRAVMALPSQIKPSLCLARHCAAAAVAIGMGGSLQSHSAPQERPQNIHSEWR